MPTWLATALLALLGLMLVFALGGVIAATRRQRATRGRLDEHVREADQQLAQAHAQDKGWERGALEAAAREAFSAGHAGQTVSALTLVQVVDRPGTDEDLAIFRVDAGGDQHELRLGRSEGRWVAL